jgi:uncharacterized protein (TIGR02996 family)
MWQIPTRPTSARNDGVVIRLGYTRFMPVVHADDRSFFEACLERPEDSVPRLVWVDYLDETDRSTAGAYLRGVRGPALIQAAIERFQAGADADRVTRLVLWLASSGLLATPADHVVAEDELSASTFRLVLRMAEGGERKFEDMVTALRIGMQVASSAAASFARMFGSRQSASLADSSRGDAPSSAAK